MDADYRKLQDKIDAIARGPVKEAVAGSGVDDLYELLDMGISKEGLFDEWVAYSSSDDIAEFVDHFKRMHDIPGDDDEIDSPGDDDEIDSEFDDVLDSDLDPGDRWSRGSTARY